VLVVTPPKTSMKDARLRKPSIESISNSADITTVPRMKTAPTINPISVPKSKTNHS